MKALPGVSVEAVVRRVDARGCEAVPAEGGAPFFASVRGRVHRFSPRERSPLAPGDRVLVARDGEQAAVQRILPRRSRFSRESASGGRPQVVAANVDLVVVLLPAAEPAANPRLADRILVTASWQDVEGAVLVSKADLAGEEGVVAALVGLYAAAGVKVLPVSVPEERGLAEVEALLRGRTSVLVGPSGAGKSTLLKRLLGPAGAEIRTGAVNLKTGKGRHTTTASQLLPFPGGGWVVDTPGVRTLSLADMDPADVARHFPGFARHGRCKFTNCLHLEEPGCGATAAVEAGELDPSRLDSYRALVRQVREEAPLRRTW